MTSSDSSTELHCEIAHILLLDVVGYSKLLVNEQIDLVRELNRIVRGTSTFKQAEAQGKLTRLPTGDGMALLFFNSPEEPVRCALEISEALRSWQEIQVRMGAHSGPVNEIMDVNDRSNIAGAGINIAQRVMDCGDAGHILLSKRIADDLAQYGYWRPFLHDLGECEVKHGLRLGVVNLHKDQIGNPAVPEKVRLQRKWRQKAKTLTRRGSPSRRPLLILAAASLILAVGLVYLVSSRILDRTKRPRKSVAVMPFKNLSENNANAHLAEGLQDEILTDLAKVADLKVISRTSVMQYTSGVERNLKEIGKQLSVSHIVEGSVQRVADQVRVNVQLIDAFTDTHVWAERYDRNVADIFSLVSELARQIVSHLKSKISPEEKSAIEEKPTADLVAYDFYVRAKNLISQAIFNNGRKETLLEAVRLLGRAIRRDSSFALAYYELAHAHDQIYLVGLDHSPERLKQADEAIQSLIRLRPNSGEAHLALARHYYWGYLDYDRAKKELAQARRVLPSDPLPYLLSGYIDRRQGRWDESTRNLERALELDPRNSAILQQVALTYSNLRKFPEMAAALDRALALNPTDPVLRVRRAAVDLEWKADTRSLHSTIGTIVSEDPQAAQSFADQWLYLALCERDPVAAEQVLKILPEDGCRTEALPFPRSWCQGIVSSLFGDLNGAKGAFASARLDVEQILRAQPEYAGALSVMGLIDAVLGYKKEAIEQGKRAVELLPISKDSINGPLVLQELALIYGLAGERDLAFQHLEEVVKVPGYLSYGQLRLHPRWDPLREDPRFEKIVAALAPK